MPVHPQVAKERYFFEEIQDAEVDTTMIVRAEDVRAFVCPDLRIEPPKIVWIRPAPPTAKQGSLLADAFEELDLS